MEPEQQRRIASKGGKAAHQSGHAHEWNSTEAAAAGRKGGLASHHDRSSFHRDAAAHHRDQAERYRSEGSHERAELHERQAEEHGEQSDQSNPPKEEARNQAASREEGYEPGRRGAEARWGGTEEEMDTAPEESGEEEDVSQESSNDNARQRSDHGAGSAPSQ